MAAFNVHQVAQYSLDTETQTTVCEPFARPSQRNDNPMRTHTTPAPHVHPADSRTPRPSSRARCIPDISMGEDGFTSTHLDPLSHASI
ncbi:hypothetical protein OBBRIDRAFT_795023 [Obba rivulosa]|uniref:Uncharacterized protein n=1 Tax=Obba rivulosa TaxID=1052685 RepID=A0A8E2ASR7_9APHY|nr:hypothetical protein OBBRIDRAFT_795023 [Obba rivulosa]